MILMQHRKPVYSLLLTLFLVGCSAEKPLETEALQFLPNLDGWWYLEETGDGTIPFPIAEAPLKSQHAGMVAGLLGQIRSGNLSDPIDLGAPPGYMCQPPGFYGFSFFGGNKEFLFTEGRLTILEQWGLVRRVAMNEENFPADVTPTNAGTSIGHWEGSTLVIETGGLNPLNPAVPASMTIGNNVHVVERINLVAPDILEFAVTLTAPDLLDGTFTASQRYHRDTQHGYIEILRCAANDRTIDPVTGRQRFDMTPPVGLPPPPG